MVLAVAYRRYRSLTSKKSELLAAAIRYRPSTSQKAIAPAKPSLSKRSHLPHPQKKRSHPHIPQTAIAKGDTYYSLNSKASHEISGNI
ncbi:hypothetical protein IQ227_09975 [Anabaena aphanizomenioides LEGE 00250]|uniref:Transposase n=1 Tax=Sphaerospermopsis aphanizomenoides LEGE 00250 TaxID=2777972 RepID=A0ABR9VE08_9CYAN|nr:hypothetical protein [Sphaerospermopsis aphanizomenoides]MBE9236352.1 hypothetical protein [Sphaerospermopsis aphanizomenoides LEGE 00250]